MRSLGIRLPLLVASVCMGWSLSVWAMDYRYGETVYLLPTTTMSGPTAYVEPAPVLTSSYFVPSALVVPSYYSTAYFSDEVVALPTSAYVETRYRRGLLGRLFGRGRLVERSVVTGYPTLVPTTLSWPAYSPTSYSMARTYSPTMLDSRVTYETAYATSPASACCDQVASTWRVPVSEAPTLTMPVRPSDGASRQVESNAVNGGTIPSDVGPDPGEYSDLRNIAPAAETTKGKSASPKGKASEAESPPPPPVVEKEKSAVGTGSGTGTQAQQKATPKDKDAAKSASDTMQQPKALPPRVPSGEKDDAEVEPAPRGGNSGVMRREVQKPAVYPVTAIRPERRNVLFGKVESSAAGEPEEEVRVIVTNRSNRAISHEGMSDAYGRFAIKLAEGDWTVNVTMRNGRIYPVSQITVSGGRIYDEREGREVPSLIITR